MKRTVLLVMIITILSKFLGFGREVALSYVYGASAVTDAYLISQTIPYVIFSFVSAGIATGFIPLYSRILNERGQLEANRYTNLFSPLIGLEKILSYAIIQIKVIFQD